MKTVNHKYYGLGSIIEVRNVSNGTMCYVQFSDKAIWIDYDLRNSAGFECEYFS